MITVTKTNDMDIAIDTAQTAKHLQTATAITAAIKDLFITTILIFSRYIKHVS
jgi:hypothetical protein